MSSFTPVQQLEEVDPKVALKKQIKLVKDGIQNFFRVQRRLAKAELNKISLPGVDHVTPFTKSDLAPYQKQISVELSKIGKLATAAMKGKKRASSGNHLTSPFFVSDQLVEFFSRVELGYGGGDAYQRVEDFYRQVSASDAKRAEDASVTFMCSQYPAGQNPPLRVQDGITHLMSGPTNQGQYNPSFFTHGLTSTQMLISLFRLYFISNRLKSKSNGTYYNLNDTFEKSFSSGTNTRLVHGGRDLSDEFFKRFASSDPNTLGESDRKLYNKVHPAVVEKSSLQRLTEDMQAGKAEKSEKSKRDSRPYLLSHSQSAGTDAWGISMPGIAKFVNFYRIPKEMLTAEEAEYLKGGAQHRMAVDGKFDAAGQPVTQSFAHIKIEAVESYLNGKNQKDDLDGTKRSGKSSVGLIDAHKLSTHMSDTESTKVKRANDSKTKRERASLQSLQAQISSRSMPVSGGTSLLFQPATQ